MGKHGSDMGRLTHSLEGRKDGTIKFAPIFTNAQYYISNATLVPLASAWRLQKAVRSLPICTFVNCNLIPA